MKTFKFACKLAFTFFLIGTVLLGLFAINLSMSIAVIGYLFMLLAFLVSAGYGVILLINLLRNKISRREGLYAIGILLVNIPVTFGYIYIVAWLMSYARITFENATGEPITSIVISGCDEQSLPALEKGGSKSVWIKVPSDCELWINYNIGGRQQHETVAGYLTNPCGIVTTYRIGTRRDIIMDM